MRMQTSAQVALLAAAALAAVVPVPEQTVERWYSTGIYPPIQHALTPVSNLVPFAVLDVLIIAGVLVPGTILVRAALASRRHRTLSPLGPALRRIAVATAVLYLVFLMLWGWNYRRVAMQDRVATQTRAVDSGAVAALGLEAASRLNRLHAQAHTEGWTSEPRHDQPLLDGFSYIQRRLVDAPEAVPGRLKQSLFGFYFRWAGIDGMIDPFALEVIANPDLLPWERPFVAAHEWAHLAGYAHEAEANFVGWLTCLRGGAAAQYSGWLFLYWQIAGEVASADRQRLADALDAGPRADVQAIVDRMVRGQLPFLRTASWTMYDHYLRANRVDEGVRSYGEVITLILRTRFDDGWAPVRRAMSDLEPEERPDAADIRQQ